MLYKFKTTQKKLKINGKQDKVEIRGAHKEWSTPGRSENFELTMPAEHSSHRKHNI